MKGAQFERKLTFRQRAEIKALYSAGYSYSALAREYKMGRDTIKYHTKEIKKGKRRDDMKIDIKKLPKEIGKPPVEYLICVCGTRFKKKHGSQIYCNPKCRGLIYKEKPVRNMRYKDYLAKEKAKKMV